MRAEQTDFCILVLLYYYFLCKQLTDNHKVFIIINYFNRYNYGLAGMTGVAQFKTVQQPWPCLAVFSTPRPHADQNGHLQYPAIFSF